MDEYTSPDTSAQYLSLSVFAESVAEALAEAMHDPGSPEWKKSLRETALALREVKQEGVNTREATCGLRPFHNYDQVATLCAVLGTDPLTDRTRDRLSSLIRLFESLPNKPRAAKKDVQQAAKIFTKLAAEALYRTRRPPDTTPQRVRELCRQT